MFSPLLKQSPEETAAIQSEIANWRKRMDAAGQLIPCKQPGMHERISKFACARFRGLLIARNPQSVARSALLHCLVCDGAPHEMKLKISRWLEGELYEYSPGNTGRAKRILDEGESYDDLD